MPPHDGEATPLLHCLAHDNLGFHENEYHISETPCLACINSSRTTVATYRSFASHSADFVSIVALESQVSHLGVRRIPVPPPKHISKSARSGSYTWFSPPACYGRGSYRHGTHSILPMPGKNSDEKARVVTAAGAMPVALIEARPAERARELQNISLVGVGGFSLWVRQGSSRTAQN